MTLPYRMLVSLHNYFCNHLFYLHNMSFPQYPQVFPQTPTGKMLKLQEESRRCRKNSTALHKAVEFFVIYITTVILMGGSLILLCNYIKKAGGSMTLPYWILSIEDQLCSEDPFVFFFAFPQGIHLQGTVFQNVPLQLQFLAFPGFV